MRAALWSPLGSRPWAQSKRHWVVADSTGSPHLLRSRRIFPIQVAGEQLTQLLNGGLRDVPQAPGVPADGCFEQVAGEPSIAEHRSPRSRTQDHFVAAQTVFGDVVIGRRGYLQKD